MEFILVADDTNFFYRILHCYH